MLAKENAQFGLIAIRSANIFVGPPLTQLSFNGNITGNGGNCRVRFSMKSFLVKNFEKIE